MRVSSLLLMVIVIGCGGVAVPAMAAAPRKAELEKFLGDLRRESDDLRAL